MAGSRATRRQATAVLAVGLLVTGCRTVPFRNEGRGTDEAVVGLGGATPYVRTRPPIPAPAGTPMPDGGVVPAADIYAATRAGMLSPAVRRIPERVYVSTGRTIDVIDPATFRTTARWRAGRAPRAVVPSWDLRTLWAAGDRLIALRPERRSRTASPVASPAGPAPALPMASRAASASGPYFTPDGGLALTLSGRSVEVRDPRTLKPLGGFPIPCADGTRLDFTADGLAVIACPAIGRLVRIDPATRAVTGVLDLGRQSRPRDVRLTPDGGAFYVADSARGGVWLVDAPTLRAGGFVPTGPGPSTLYPSRDGRVLYVVQNDSVALISIPAHTMTGRWHLPGPSGPGGVSADGSVLWLAGRDGLLAVSTANGRVLHTVHLSAVPRGVCVYPQPGGRSLGPFMR